MSPQTGHAHCQIPCGIYDDHARVQAMLEDAATVDKSARSIAALAGKSDPQSQNQLVRWVMNKEKHAQNVITFICEYFLTQRVKPGDANYADKIKALHELLIYAMKCKQTTDIANVEKLRRALKRFEKLRSALAFPINPHK